MRTLRYYGGKSPLRTGRWVASLLPVRKSYVEPFAGMLGVLLSRGKSRFEVANDLDGRIVEWWRVVRDDSEELARRLALTPYSKTVFDEAYEQLDSAVGVDLAWCVSVVLGQGYTASLEHSGWRAAAEANYQSLGRSWATLPDSLCWLSWRLQDVMLECRDALELLGGWVCHDDCVVYCDPPYRGLGLYGADVDLEEMADVLRGCKADVAVSGYVSCGWDELLGWDRHDHETFTSLGRGGEPRVECLWTNFRLQGRLL